MESEAPRRISSVHVQDWISTSILCGWFESGCFIILSTVLTGSCPIKLLVIHYVYHHRWFIQWLGCMTISQWVRLNSTFCCNKMSPICSLHVILSFRSFLSLYRRERNYGDTRFSFNLHRAIDSSPVRISNGIGLQLRILLVEGAVIFWDRGMHLWKIWHTKKYKYSCDTH